MLHFPLKTLFFSILTCSKIFEHNNTLQLNHLTVVLLLLMFCYADSSQWKSLNEQPKLVPRNEMIYQFL